MSKPFPQDKEIEFSLSPGKPLPAEVTSVMLVGCLELGSRVIGLADHLWLIDLGVCFLAETQSP